jgi:hypothetical protein
MLSLVQRVLGLAGSWTDEDGGAVSAPTIITCAGSSDGTDAGMDGVNRWDSTGDLVWQTEANARSWMVLRGPRGDLLIELVTNSSSNTHVGSLWWSPTGFGSANGGTDGSTTTRPTATSEAQICSGNWGGPSSAAASVSHVWISDEGDIRWVICRSGTPVGVVCVEAPGVDLVGDAWDHKASAWHVGTSLAVPSSVPTGLADIYDNSAAQEFGFRGSSLLTFAKMSVGFNPSTDFQNMSDNMSGPHAVTGEYPLLPVGAFCITSENVGWFCWYADRWGGLGSVASGFTFPGDEALEADRRQLVQFGTLILPWNKSNPVLAAS